MEKTLTAWVCGIGLLTILISAMPAIVAFVRAVTPLIAVVAVSVCVVRLIWYWTSNRY